MKLTRIAGYLLWKHGHSSLPGMMLHPLGLQKHLFLLLITIRENFPHIYTNFIDSSSLLLMQNGALFWAAFPPLTSKWECQLQCWRRNPSTCRCLIQTLRNPYGMGNFPWPFPSFRTKPQSSKRTSTLLNLSSFVSALFEISRHLLTIAPDRGSEAILPAPADRATAAYTWKSAFGPKW